MSHFTCLITGTDLDGQLEPYNENTRVERYQDAVDMWALRGLREDGLLPADGTPTAQEYLDALHKKYPPEGEDEDERVFINDAGELVQWSTYNPQSKWDWWVIGGRWTGYFLLKDSVPQPVEDYNGGNGGLNRAAGINVASYIYRSPFGNGEAEGNRDPRRADTAPKGLIDLAGMRAEKGEKAGTAWDLYHEAVDGLAPMKHWDEFRKLVEAGSMTIERAREQYHNQPRVVQIKTLGKLWYDKDKNDPRAGWYWDCEHAELEVDRRLYVVRAEAQAVPGYAMLHEGNWIAPGKMGWFGYSSDTESERWGYLEHVNGLIDALPDETQLTVCDLHI